MERAREGFAEAVKKCGPALPSPARSKSSEKSRSFFFAIGQVGMEGRFGPSVVSVGAASGQAIVRKRG